MGNNAEIRQRMETYRSVLLVINWVAAIGLLIGAFIMIGYETGGGWSGSSYPLRPYGIALLIVSIISGIIGHFLINVTLAIPFILLNNGDYLAAMSPKTISNNDNYQTTNDWVCTKCNHTNRTTALFCNNCGEKK